MRYIHVDIFDLKGIPTAAGSREYGELYGERDETSLAVNRLEDIGGVIVGKTKTNASVRVPLCSDAVTEEGSVQICDERKRSECISASVSKTEQI